MVVALTFRLAIDDERGEEWCREGKFTTNLSYRAMENLRIDVW